MIEELKMKPALLDFPMPIITPRLLLKPPQLGDGKTLNVAVLETFDTLHKFMPWAKKKPTLEESEEFVRQAAANWILKNNQDPYLPLFIFDKSTEEFVGATGFHDMNWDVPCLETGYWIRDQCSGKGLMIEAMDALTRYAINQLKVKRIEIRCDIKNIRSKKIPERLGYYLEATLKSNRIDPATGSVSDTLVYVRHNVDNLPPL